MHGNETAVKKIVVFEILLSFANLPGLFPKYMRVSPADVEIAHRILRYLDVHMILRTEFAHRFCGQPIGGIESYSFAPLTRELGPPDQCSPHWYTGGPITRAFCTYTYTYIYIL